MKIEDLTLGELLQVSSARQVQPNRAESAYEVGGSYMFRTVTHIITGRLLSIHPDGFRVTDAAWIANTGRYADAVASGDFEEVEPYPDGAIVIVNQGAMIDAVQIPRLPRVRK